MYKNNDKWRSYGPASGALLNGSGIRWTGSVGNSYLKQTKPIDFNNKLNKLTLESRKLIYGDCKENSDHLKEKVIFRLKFGLF